MIKDILKELVPINSTESADKVHLAEKAILAWIESEIIGLDHPLVADATPYLDPNLSEAYFKGRNDLKTEQRLRLRKDRE